MLVQAEQYLRGLVQAGRKNMERMAEVVPDTDYQRLQHFLSHSPWDHQAAMRQVASEAERLLGGQKFSLRGGQNACPGAKGLL